MARIVALLGTVLIAGGLAGCGTSQNGVSPTAWAAVESGTAPTELVISSLDPASQRKARAAELRALDQNRTGVPASWRSGSVRGEVIPGPQYQVNAYTCRDFTHVIYDGGPPHQMRATACREPNGSWQPVT